MQAMKKNMLFALVLLVLAACQTSGGGSESPWNRAAYNTQAQSAPSALTRDAAAAQTQNPAYAQYTPPAAAAGQPPQQQQVIPAPAYTAVPQQNPVPGAGYAAAPMPIPHAMQGLPPVKVALLLPLSGPQHELGESMLQAAQLALFDMGYQSFELMPRDTGSNPGEAAQAARSALAEGAQLILGPLFAADVRAVKPVAAAANVNVVAFSTDWTLAGGNTFVMGFLPFGQVARVAGYAASQGYGRIGIIAPESQYGDAVLSAWNTSSRNAGIATQGILRYKPGADENSSLVRSFTRYDEREQYSEQQRAPLEARLKANPDDTAAKASLAALEQDMKTRLPFQAVLLPVGGEEAREVTNLLNFFDLGPDTVKRLGTGLWDDQGLAAEPSLKGAWFAAPSPDLRRDFETRYRDLYGKRPQRLSTLAYDATALAAVLAKKGFQETGRPAWQRTDLMNPNGFAGIDGIFRFRPDGLVERGLAVLEYRAGTTRVIDPAPATFQNPGY